MYSLYVGYMLAVIMIFLMWLLLGKIGFWGKVNNLVQSILNLFKENNKKGD